MCCEMGARGLSTVSVYYTPPFPPSANTAFVEFWEGGVGVTRLGLDVSEIHP